MDCVAEPYDEEAIEAVLRAFRGDSKQYFYGPKDPYNRRVDRIDNLKTRPNPKGVGVIVSSWKDTSREGFSDYSRDRSAWLVLDGQVFPINQEAANAFGFLYDGLPQAVQRVAGLVHSYERGRTMLDQLGIDAHTYERRFSGGNPFPMCT